jgi:hypothetical protein
MRKLNLFAVVTSLAIGLTIAPSAHAKAKITKPSAPTVVSVTSSTPKKGKVNVTVVIALPTSDGGSKITGSKVSAGGKSCTMNKLKTSCTIKGIKNGKSLNVTARTKNKKGFGGKSANVSYVAGSSLQSASATNPTISNGFISAGSGCGNSIFYDAVDSNLIKIASKTLVGTTGNTSLTPMDVNIGGKRLLYSAYDCAAGTTSLLEKAIVPSGQSTLIPLPDSSLVFVDAAFDVMSGSPIALFRNSSSQNYYVYKYAGGWSLSWSTSVSSLSSSLIGIEGSTGGEYYVFGNALLGSSWNFFRVSSGGSASLATSGTGSISNVSQSTLESVTVFMGSSTWACSGASVGAMTDALTRQTCTDLGLTGQSYGTLAGADTSSKYWFVNGYGGNRRILVECSGVVYSTRCSISRPNESFAGSTSGQNYLNAYPLNIDYWNL